MVTQILVSLKLRIHLANVWPNKSEHVWGNARRAFATAVRAFPLTSTCDKDTPIAYTFVRRLSGISFDVRLFTAYLANIGKRRTNMTESVRSCLLRSPHLANAHICLCLAKHFCQVYMQLNLQFISSDRKKCLSDTRQKNLSMTFIRKFFKERVIFVGLWPPRSLDLSPASFFFMGLLEGCRIKEPAYNFGGIKNRNRDGHS